MAFRFVLLVLPALALAKIDVQLSGDFDTGLSDSNLQVYYSGSEVGVISDKERGTFKLDDNNLKSSVNKYFGKRPDDAFLHSPTPWGDLYKTYGWPEVLRTLVPRNGKILTISSQPQVVMQQVFENNSTKPATFNVGISQSVQNTVTSTWSKGGDLSIGQEISYEFDIKAVSGGGTTSISYTSSWGESTEQSQSVTVGSSTAMEITLEPGQAVVAELQADRGSIKVEMEYRASLAGATAVNYADPYQGHHFWALDISAVMDAGNLSNDVVSKEVIDIGFYASSKVLVHDKKTGAQVFASDYFN